LDKQIVSLDSGGSGKFGDVLNNEKKENCPVKVGLLACGYFEYWRMYPALQKTVKKDMDKAASRLSSALGEDAVYPGLVDTIDAAESAGRIFADARVDIIVIIEGTYLPDFIVLHALEHVPDAEIILYSTQTGENVNPEDNYEATMRNSALIGIAQLSATFRKASREYKVVVGEISDMECYREILLVSKSLRIKKNLRRFKIGMIGHVFRGMFDLEFDRGSVRGVLGPEVVSVQMENLLDIWRNVKAGECETAAAELLKYNVKVPKKELRRSVKLGLAMRKLAKLYKLDALCFLGQHYIEKMTGTPVRIGASMLVTKDKMPVSCEGDAGGVIMMYIMQELTGNPPIQLEWGQFDLKENALFLLGHGICNPSLSAEPGAVSLTGAPEEWGFEGNGVNWEFIIGPGPVTMGHFLNTPQGWQMLISEGESLNYPCLPCGEVHAMVRIKPPVKEYLKNLLELGAAHHIILAHGSIRRELGVLAEMLGIRKAVL
jgi:L-arabinose isomerase